MNDILETKYKGYFASKDGEVIGKYGRPLSKRKDKWGFYRINIAGGTAFIHRVILETFNPVENMGNMDVHHIDGDKTNNSLENLCWIRHNQFHKRGKSRKVKE